MNLLTILHDFIYAERPRNPRCSYCRRRWKDVGKLLVEGPEAKVFICDSCIDYCRESMDAEKKRRGLIPPEESKDTN